MKFAMSAKLWIPSPQVIQYVVFSSSVVPAGAVNELRLFAVTVVGLVSSATKSPGRSSALFSLIFATASPAPSPINISISESTMSEAVKKL